MLYNAIESNSNLMINSLPEEFPMLKTKRLILRQPRLTDAEDVLSIRSYSSANKHILRKATQSIDEATASIEALLKEYEENKAIGWTAVLQSSRKFLGTCSVNNIDWANRRGELGGELSIEYWGKGLAPEAMNAMLEFAFTVLGLHSIEAKVSPSNRSAIYGLEMLGFEKEAHFKDRIYHEGSFHDLASYTLFSHTFA